MRAFIALLLCGCGGADCPPPETAPTEGLARPASAADTAAARSEIAAVLDDWHDAAARADENRYFSHFATDAVFLGTDATERWDRDAFREYAHPHFESGRAWSFRSARREVIVSRDGSMAWFDEDLETENLGPSRGSGVMIRDSDGKWRIVHYNLAITVPNERFQAVRELLAEDDGASAE